ncbi:TolC family protein [Pedobacter gandavensis]|uniref:TolC family protein n=1 Tax=Pedobacter gandavensis TaxID=2679963 RepID=UPI00292D282C|nr:TolC family protein [Pedobacter gandavensis]
MQNTLKHLITFLLLFVTVNITNAQSEKISLEECHQLARTNYPVIKKLGLIAQTSGYDIQNANKRFLPQVNFSGQASYQSETVSFPDALGMAGFAGLLPVISKDQYRIQGEVNQLIYDGGNTKKQKDLIKANSGLQEQNLEVNLYGIKQRINSIYFSILLMDAQLNQNELNKANLQTQMQKTEAALKNGVAFRSNLDELKAEVLNMEMTGTEYKSNRKAYLSMLSLFIGKELSSASQLEIPKANSGQVEINRPELKAFDFQKSIYDTQRKQLSVDYLPQVNAFFQAAYGRPTLNIIENKFGPWYITGIKFNWSLGSLYALSNKRNNLSIQQQSVEVDRETFLLNTRIDLSQQDENVKKYSELIKQDEEAIALRSSVTKSAAAQLENGVITTHEYIQKLNSENLARENKIVHEIQLLQAIYNHKFITGN